LKNQADQACLTFQAKTLRYPKAATTSSFIMPKSDSKNSVLGLGSYLSSIRADRGLTLREVEEKTDSAVSNAYLSQIERELVPKPSARVLRALADAYKIDGVSLLERAGYVDRPRPSSNARQGRGNAFAEHSLTPEEEVAMLDFLRWYRHQNRLKK
jgi:HTH-type transcriptional regulator, competence development regulator